ncbi:MAG: glycosyltransferase family 1 protein [Micrococcales bacterium]|nr:glycosyltransferase family 1 protein [Micrococcales bacterium]
MRIAIVAESFLPSVNGVTTSVCRVLESLRALGHDAIVIAARPAPASFAGFPVHTVASVPVRQFQVGLPSPEIVRVLDRFDPDVVHVASPFVLGARGLTAAQALGIPSVAIYQTDMPSYVRQHAPSPGIGRSAERATWRWVRRIHSTASRTLAPSTSALEDLRLNGVPRTGLWGRGVDTRLFYPGWRQDAGTRALRRTLAPGGETLIGYVGRLAPEKELHRLVELTSIPHSRLVLVGDGPSREEVGATLAEAVASSAGRPTLPPVFLGRRDGDDLARAYAAFDLFVHTGTRETFGQTLQEAAAMGLPVVAPARGGPLDLVAHGQSGYLFDPDTPGSLREHVDPLVASAALRDRLGSAGVASVRSRSWLGLTEQLLGHYAAVSDRRGLAVAA